MLWVDEEECPTKRFLLTLFICFCSLAFAVYAGIESYQIASAGVTYAVPQLEGDGGGGLLIAVVAAISGAIAFIRLWIAQIGLAITSLLALGVGTAFADRITSLWAWVPVLLILLTGVGQWWLHRQSTTPFVEGASYSNQKLQG
jgi:hypothetical protein